MGQYKRTVKSLQLEIKELEEEKRKLQYTIMILRNKLLQESYAKNGLINECRKYKKELKKRYEN